ncbi:MAG: ATP-dependent Clp protease adaptor protein ClpS [Saprospiraceae bacterium]|jgi:ATP-dependent Clp protease adaptor protein ClpS|tara:strand:+ start:58 stop:369 length:312 start_codon:yes stop_codon:yes gene_type:complete
MTTEILNIDVQELEDTMLLEDISTGQKSELIVYNDDFNTFDWVIQSFMEVCSHTFEQSEQLSLFVHYKGQAIVKTGPMSELRPLKDALIERGLSAIIESAVDK